MPIRIGWRLRRPFLFSLFAAAAVLLLRLLPEIVYELRRTGPIPNYDESWLTVAVLLTLLTICVWQFVSAIRIWRTQGLYECLRSCS